MLAPTDVARDRGRSRPAVALALGLVIAGGLASRSGAAAVPAFVARHAGDALWTVAAYLASALAWPRARPARLAALALALSVLVELSQLAHPAWLEALRARRLGALLLGRGFVAADLARYAAGALLALGLDRLALWRPSERSRSGA